MLITPINSKIQSYTQRLCQNTQSRKIENSYNTNPLAYDTFTPSVSFKAAIHDYAETGDLEGVKHELENGVDINIQNVDRNTALIYACAYGWVEIAKELLKYPDIDVNVQNYLGYNALIYACAYGLVEIAKELLNNPKINVNIQNENENTALILASYRGHTDTVEELLKHPDINLNLKNCTGRTALDYAKEKGYTEIEKMIEDYVPVVDRRENKPLTENVTNKNQTNKNQPCTIPDYERIGMELVSTDPFMKNLGFEDLTKYIDSDEFNPEAKDNLGRNVIQLSMLSRDERVKTIISKALAKGVDINAVDMVGQTSLMKAIKNLVTADNDEEKMVDLSVIKFILDQNPDIDIQDKNKQTAFHLACMSTSVALLTLILLKDPHILLKDVKGKKGADYLKTDELKDLYKKYVL